MGINVFPAPATGGGGDSWELVNTTTIPSYVTSVNISNLSGYKSYRLVCPHMTTLNANYQYIRFNSDSGEKYTTIWQGEGSSLWNSTSKYAEIRATSYSNQSQPFTIDITIEFANTNSAKTYYGWGMNADGTSNNRYYKGLYDTSSPITSITIFGNFYGQNEKIYLYGIPE